MADRKLAIDTAADFTRRALELLDSVGDTGAAVHLQAALDVLFDAPVPSSLEEVEAMLQSPEAQRIMARWDGPGAERELQAVGAQARRMAAELTERHADKALGRARMQLFTALHDRDHPRVQLLTWVCYWLTYRDHPTAPDGTAA